MDVLKKLKSVFVVEDANAPASSIPVEPSPQIKEEQPISVQSSQKTEIQTPTFDASSLKGKAPDEKFTTILLEAIEKANFEGFDYLEYKSSLQSLSKMNMDTATKYQSAMAMAKTMGATPQKIIQTANQYLNVLKEENDKFLMAVQSQRQKVSQDENEGLSSLKSSIENKKKQIAQLQQEIVNEEAQLTKMQAEIGASSNKIAETAAKFDHAYVAVTQQIVDDIKNITQYASN